MICGNSINQTAIDSLSQSFPVLRCLNGRVAFDAGTQCLIVLFRKEQMRNTGFCRDLFLYQRYVRKQAQLFSCGNMHDVQAGVCLTCQLHCQFG